MCDCGKITVTRLVNFLNGITKSCGCLTLKQSEFNISPKIHGLSNHPLYIVWRNMIQRCNDLKCVAYSSYGGRGVKVCEEWEREFESFYQWAICNGWRKVVFFTMKRPKNTTPSSAPFKYRFICQSPCIYF